MKENKTWYCAGSWSDRIKARIVVRESESSIWFENGTRAVKKTSLEQWFQTFEEAKEYQIALTKDKILGLERNLEYAKKKLEHFESLTEPTA